MAHKLGKKLLSWDESIDDAVRFRLNQQEEELKEGGISANEWKTEKDIEQEIYTDQDYWDFRWNDFTEYLTTTSNARIRTGTGKRKSGTSAGGTLMA